MKLFVFTNPQNAAANLRHDQGWLVTGLPDANSEGRYGLSFAIPNGTNNLWGCELNISAPGMSPLRFRARLGFGENNEAYLLADDFQLIPEKECPPVNPPVDPSNDEPRTPLEVINMVYLSGAFNLMTHTGCGLFTEACCMELHERFSKSYGHVKKTGSQNQFNGHAVDAVHLLRSHPNDDGTITEDGIYDIIISSVSPDAQPAFNFAGAADPNLWYYPAAKLVP